MVASFLKVDSIGSGRLDANFFDRWSVVSVFELVACMCSFFLSCIKQLIISLSEADFL